MIVDDGQRIKDLNRFYILIDQLKEKVNGFRYLSQCHGQMGWPKQGVYFFFEPAEFRNNSSDLRVVRVGTHAVSVGSKTTLWERLRMHRGHSSGGGNHRGSIFRLNIGLALIGQKSYPSTITATWGRGNSAPKEIRMNEQPLEFEVSTYLGLMPFLWLRVEDEAGPKSQRKYLERNAIGLLSGMHRCCDHPSNRWLGNFSPKQTIRSSGLWNSDHVDEHYEPTFLRILKEKIECM